MSSFRKRILVTEGDLYQLYKEIQQIRKSETKELCNTKFRALLKEAQFVSFTINPKKEV
jgi:hypothetical protein